MSATLKPIQRPNIGSSETRAMIPRQVGGSVSHLTVWLGSEPEPRERYSTARTHFSPRK